jgi:hypothetical protein
VIYKEGWLVINQYRAPRFVKNKPTLQADEIAIYLDVRLPDALFVKPTLQATVTVKDEAVTPEILTPDIVVNTAAAIEKATGMKVEIRVVPQEKAVVPPKDTSPLTPYGEAKQRQLRGEATQDDLKLILETEGPFVVPGTDEPYFDPDDMSGGAHDPDRGR